MNDQAEFSIERKAPDLDNAAKRALIEAELRSNPNRSDREIERALGNRFCHKTIGAHRRRLGIASPLGNVIPPQTGAEAIECEAAGEKVDLKDYPALQAAQQRNETKFDPYDPKEGCLIVTTQLAIACYINTQNCVVIRQEDPSDDDDDMIVIQRDHLPKVIAALRELQSELDDIIREEAAARS